MGCASSKKQTTSVEDIPKAVEKAGSKPTQSSAPTNKSKNGQVTANANANEFKLGSPPAKKEVVKPTSATPPESSTASDAIQIPGAHKSFLAPDGIPFIDEDVDDEIETGHPEGDNSSIPVVGGTVVVKPDVNKNVVKEPVSPSQPPAQPSVAPVKAPTAVAAAPERHPNDQPTPAQPPQQQQQPSEQDKSWVAAVDVLKSDLEFPTQPVVEQTSTTHGMSDVLIRVEYFPWSGDCILTHTSSLFSSRQNKQRLVGVSIQARPWLVTVISDRRDEGDAAQLVKYWCDVYTVTCKPYSRR